MKSILRTLLIWGASFFTGITFSSLIINHSENWKFALPTTLLFMLAYIVTNELDNK